MAKRGPRPFDLRHNALMPLPLIAARLGVSVRTVAYDLKSAMRKLKADRDAISGVLDTVYGVAECPDDIKATSAECRREFVAKWNGGK